MCLLIAVFSCSEPVKPPLVIVLGLKEKEREALGSILESFGTPPELMPTFITNESGQGKDRAGKQGLLLDRAVVGPIILSDNLVLISN